MAETNEKKYYLYEMKVGILNTISIIFLLLLVLFTYLINKDIKYYGDTMDFAMLLLIPYLILHELLHSLSYVLHGASFKNITYGAHLEKGILCCLCKQNITKKNILISALYPFIIIGIITYIIGIFINNSLLVWLSIFNIIGCSGDLIMFLAFLQLKDFEYSEYDNPIAFGLYSKTDLSNKKLFGLKYIGCQEELEKKDLKKVSISKESILYFLIFVVIIFLDLLFL